MFAQPQQLHLHLLLLLISFIILGLLIENSTSLMSTQEIVRNGFNVNVNCDREAMKVTINFNETDEETLVYLDKLKDYPGCQPNKSEKTMVFVLPIGDDFYSCGTTMLRNKLTDFKVFYHRLIVDRGPAKKKEVVLVNCFVPNDFSLMRRNKRQLDNGWNFPENFTESVEELIDYSGNVTERAPIPILNIAVRKNGETVDTALNVHPGTPLEMIIYLDDESAKVYGLLTTFLKVTDNSPYKQEEVIILNGCSIDPYIFSNFQTSDGGNSVSAKFRAFKFPESNFVLFVGTVNVCLKECQGVQCGNNQLGFGRRKRTIPYEIPADPNKVYEVEMTAFIKVEPGPTDTFDPTKVATITSEFGEEEVKLENITKSPINVHHQPRKQGPPLPLLTSHGGSGTSALESIPWAIFVYNMLLVTIGLYSIN